MKSNSQCGIGCGGVRGEGKGIDIVFENVSYSVEVEKERKGCGLPFFKEYQQKIVIHDVSGVCKAGEVTAIMGASGAGKTTLLNIMACKIDHQKERDWQMIRATAMKISGILPTT